MSTLAVPLTRGLVAVIDHADAELIQPFKWRADRRKHTAYAACTIRKAGGRYTSRLMHSVITGWPMVDHINGDGLDNRRANLRPADYSQNSANCRKQRGRQSRFKGVGREGEKWRAYIKHHGQHRRIGLFATEAAAAAAYNAAAAELFGQYARLNQIEIGESL